MSELFAGVCAADFGSTLLWYERLFGRPAAVVPKAGEASGRWLRPGGSTSSTTRPARARAELVE